ILLFVGDPPVGATPASPSVQPTGPNAGSLGAVIGSFKSAVTRSINRLRPGAAANLWQPNYYDHVIRNDHAHDRIRDYIDDNPYRWALDAENPFGVGTDDVIAFCRALAEEGDAGVAPTKLPRGGQHA